MGSPHALVPKHALGRDPQQDSHRAVYQTAQEIPRKIYWGGTALGTAILCDARSVHENLFANARSDGVVAELPAAGQEAVTSN